MDSEPDVRSADGSPAVRAPVRGAEIVHVVCADDAELTAHEAMLALIDKASGGRCVWLAAEAARAAAEPHLHVA
jgi:hypothetical protein